MVARLTDSEQYAHLWGTEELRAVFEERRRLQSWLDILVALAAAQAELGIIPADAAAAIAVGRVGRPARPGLRGRRDPAHLPLHARPHPRPAAGAPARGGRARLLRGDRPGRHRHLDGAGHAQRRRGRRARPRPDPGRCCWSWPTATGTRSWWDAPTGSRGLPITFGLKAASWADEVDRHLDRLRQGAPRWLVGQLGGAVGTLAFFGDHGLELRARFCAQLGLADPGISWLTARDRLAEFGNLLAMVAATLARIGNEVYELQRPEIGELREAVGPEVVGSITMPHKRNPEGSEHLVTLGRLVRVQAGLLLEGMVAEHERDGRAWKAEWAAFPEVCLLTGAALALAGRLLDGLEVDAEAMARNLAASRGYTASERVLAALAPAIGKHRAQALLQEAMGPGAASGQSLEETLLASPELLARLDAGRVRSLLAGADTGSAGAMVDEVVGRLRAGPS